MIMRWTRRSHHEQSVMRFARLLTTLGFASAVASGCGGETRHDRNADAGSGGIGPSVIGGAGGTGGVAGEFGTGGTGGFGGVVTTCSLPANYSEILEQGLWLCGWSGGLEHYSWVYFDSGALSILDADCPSCTSYFGCAGTDGEYLFGELMGSVIFTTPSSCPEPRRVAWMMTELCPPDGVPPGSLAYATFTDTTGEFRCDLYPSEQCNTALSSCPAPW